MCDKILQSRTWYKKISRSIIEKYNEHFYSLVDEGFSNGAIDGGIWEYVWTKHPGIPTFYILPKVHKDTQTPLGRPIIPGIGRITENLSKFIELRPHVQNIPSYIKDTIHLLKNLEGI